MLGAIIGRDALKRLDTDGYWDIEVTVWLPPEHQRQPWSCILDGLQISSGATLGKQNIRMAWPPEATSTSRRIGRSAGGVRRAPRSRLIAARGLHLPPQTRDRRGAV